MSNNTGDQPAGAASEPNNISETSAEGVISSSESASGEFRIAVLDAGRSMMAPGAPEPQPSLYTQDCLLVTAVGDEATALVSHINDLLRSNGLLLVPDDRTGLVSESVDECFVSAWRIARSSQSVSSACDAWGVLQHLRKAGFDDDRLCLDHVVVAAGAGGNNISTGDSPYDPNEGLPSDGDGGSQRGPFFVSHPYEPQGPFFVSHPYEPQGPFFVSHPYEPQGPFFVSHPHRPGSPAPLLNSHAPMSGAQPDGSLVRIPVGWTLPDPAVLAGAPSSGRRPTIAVLDTCLGNHPWFSDARTTVRDLVVDGHRLGALADDPQAPIQRRDSQTHDIGTAAGAIDLAAVTAPFVGHGTFVAGLIRQQCPMAQIISVPVLDDHGVAREATVVRALQLLLRQHRRAIDGGEGIVIDVINLSFGFYHEGDNAASGALSQALAACRAAGIAVVASAGNHATTRKWWPAALAGEPSDQSMAPIVSVGALNPDGSSTAWWCNAGDWVTHHRPATNVVSCFDRRLSATLHQSEDRRCGPVQPRMMRMHGGRKRSSVDADDFGGGFAISSGSSFAAPVLAGELASSMHRLHEHSVLDVQIGIERAQHAVKLLDAERTKYDIDSPNCP